MILPKIKDLVQVINRSQTLFTTHVDDTVLWAATKMACNSIGCLVVLDLKNSFAGILSERDLISKVLTESRPADQIMVREIMTPNPVSCTMEATVEDAEKLMARHSIRHLPITENGLPIGMLSSRDLIAYRMLTNRAAKDAAENVAMLTTGLKSLQFDDVVRLALNQIPDTFHAGCAALYLSADSESQARIFRHGCTANKNCLTQLEAGKVPSFMPFCDNNQGCTCLLIPLHIHSQLDSSEAPLSTGSFMCLGNFEPLSPESEQVMLYKASLVQQVISGGLNNARIYSSYQQARRESEIDALTGVGSRRTLERVLAAEHCRCKRYQHTFAVGILDMDNFKYINDTAGHAAGDIALRSLASTMQKTLRNTDIITRYGGDEFVVILLETCLEEAVELFERLRQEIESLQTELKMKVTVSCGVTQCSGTSDDTVDDIMARADAALYKAKRLGRNCVVSEFEPVAVGTMNI